MSFVLSEGPECLTPNGRGSVEGWAFSIDTVFLDFLSNSFVDGGLRGRLALPIAESSPLQYRAILQRDVSNNFGFQFAVQPSGNLEIPIWSATLTLAPTSIIGLNIGTLGSAGSQWRQQGHGNGLPGRGLCLSHGQPYR